jgi:hypothetical protein
MFGIFGQTIPENFKNFIMLPLQTLLLQWLKDYWKRSLLIYIHLLSKMKNCHQFLVTACLKNSLYIEEDTC